MHQIWVPLENTWFLLLSSSIAREWLEIDTDLLHCLMSFLGVTKSMTLTDLETPKIWVLSDFFAILGCDAHSE